MATFIKRGNRWHVQVYRYGVRKSATFDTKREANTWARETEDALTVADTLQMAFERYANDECPKHKGERWEKLRLAKIAKSFPEKSLFEFTPEDFAIYRDKRLKEVSTGTVRREFNLINQVLNVALKEWGWIKTNPLSSVRKPSQPRPRRRGVSEKEIKLMLRALAYTGDVPKLKKQFVACAFLFALETGMRAGEICSLTWERVFLPQRFVRLIETKNGDIRDVPLSQKAIDLLIMIRPDRYDKVDLCFNLNAESLSSNFRKAKSTVGLEDLHFHDSRSEALTRLSKKLNVLELARVIGHRSPASLMIYYSESASDIAKKL